MNGIQEVVGSIPIGSTTFPLTFADPGAFAEPGQDRLRQHIIAAGEGDIGHMDTHMLRIGRPAMRTLILTFLMTVVTAAEPALAAAGGVLAGTFEVVALRAASDVAGGPIDAAAKLTLGRRAQFGGTAEWIDGTTCTSWSLEPRGEDAVATDDPNLSDLQLAKANSPPLNRSWRLMCDETELATFLQVDARVLVAPSPSGQTNLLLERVPPPQEIITLQAGLKAHGHLDGPLSGNMEAATRRALALYAEELGAAFAFQQGVMTEHLLESVSRPSDDTRTLKTVVSGSVSAHFRGTREQLAPLEYGVEELWFRFHGDAGTYPFKPTGTLHFSDWFFGLFSQDGSFVLLPQDRFGPYHVVRIQHLKEYLLGRREADDVVGGQTGVNATAQVHSDANWLSNTEFAYTTTCCGESAEHRHSIRFLDYRPKQTPDTALDYRPELSLAAGALPDFAAEDVAALADQMEKLITAARGKPGAFVQGNIALGANPQEYVPSDEELLAARFGDAFVELLNKIEGKEIEVSWDPAKLGDRTLIYYRFIYRHVDVMGSGRFFYASPPIPTALELRHSQQ